MPAHEATPSTSARESRVLAGFLVALALLFGARALQAGTSLGDALKLELFVALWIVLPGWAFYAGRRGADEDGLSALGMACASGFALQALASLLLRVLGLPYLMVFWPIVALPWVLRRAQQRRATAQEPRPALPGGGQLALLLALLAFVLARTELLPGDSWFTTEAMDQLFHLGNAAEFARHWPLLDPRIATLPLNYHFLCYAAATGAEQALGLPLDEWMLRAGSLVAPLFLALQVWNCARLLSGRAAAGSAALLLLCVGPSLTSTTNLLFGAQNGLLFNAQRSMEGALYLSKPSPVGMLLFAGLIPLVRRWLAGGPGLATSCLLALAMSGMKGSIGPVLLAGLALDALVRLLRRQESARRAWIQFAALALVSAVFTLWLSLGSGNFATAMFRYAPLASVETSGMYIRVLQLGHWTRDAEPVWLAALLAPFWLVLVLGPALLGAALCLAARRAAALEELWLWGTLLAGLALALGLAAPGNNELFFLHPGQIALAILAAGALAAPFEDGRRLRAAILLVLALPWLLGGVLRIAETQGEERRTRELAASSASAQLEALHWLRDHTDPDALVLLRSNALYVSALAERRAFHESYLFSPEASLKRWSRGPRGWKLGPIVDEPVFDPDKLRERVVAGEQQALALLRARVPGTGRVYELFESGSAPTEASLAPHAERVFRNSAFEIWREKD
jgi:hypothetical protein